MLLLIAVIVGIVLGAGWNGEFGAVVGGILGWLLVRDLRHERALGALRRSLTELQRAPVGAQPPSASATTPMAEPAPAAGSASTEETEPLPLAEPAAPAAMSSTEATTVPPHGWPSTAPDALESPAVSSRADGARTADDLLAPIRRWLFGGNTIVKVGVGILFIGLAFLAKFASEHVHVPVELRLAGIGAVAVALLVVGWRLRLRRPGYAQALQGGAVAVLYLTLFVAFRFGVMSPLPVFALMVGVAALAAALAVLQDAKALAVIGAIGGFATPLLVSTGSGNHVALFSYYLVLDLGIAVVAWHRTWRSLNLIGFLGTFVVATAWGVLRYDSANYASCQAFLIAFFVLFVAVMLMPARARANDDNARADWPGEIWINGSLLFGLPTIAFVLQYGLVRHTDYGVAISALVLAAFYVALARWMRTQPRLAVAFEGSLAVATVFLTLVIPFALDARSTAGAWALEGAGLVWLGLRQARGRARVFGYGLLLLSGLTLVFAHERHGTPAHFFNAIFFNGVLTAAASLIAAWAVQRAIARGATAASGSRLLVEGEAAAGPLLIGWGTLWLLAAAAVQIDAFVFQRFALTTWLSVFSGITLLYALLSVRLRWPRVGLPAIAHAPLHAVGVCIVAATLARPLQDGGAWAWPLALLAHLVVLRWLAPHWPAAARTLAHALGALVVAGLGALQGRAITAGWGDDWSAWPWLGWLVVPALILLALPRVGTARRWPVSAAPSAYQSIVGGVLTAALLLWTVVANLASNGSAQPLPHVPLLNPLDLGVGVALFASGQWLRSDVASPLVAQRQALAPTLLAFAGFVWLNAMLIRAFHHYGGVPYHLHAWLHSLAVQTGITLLWTAIALAVMWWSARRGLRVPWLVGATLLAAVVLKLLLIDQSGTGTVTRIVSFIGVGVLMLVIGYVAPLPTKREEPRHAPT
ncbi:MAG TPA: DUF2339 domain-containing protein [Burkholderiaceae bacterium]|nr:DUF2339 domain-containing protein [Burkholderiaceae bacterium]